MAWRWVILAILLIVGAVACAAPIEDRALLDVLSHAPTARDYPHDDAVWLLREVEITVEPSGAFTVRERKLVTLLTEASLSLAQWQIPYDNALERVEVVTARTLLNGHAFAVDPARVVDSAVYPGVAWYDSLVIRRFPMPAAIVGATLEVETLTHHPTPRMPGEFSTRLHLQQGYPVREARFVVRIPREKRLAIRFANITAPQVQEREEQGQRVYRWSVQQTPSLRLDEPQSPPAADLIASARLCWHDGWQPVVDWYRGLTDDKAAVTDAVRQVAEARTRGCRTDEEKIAALHQAVRELPYVAVEMGMLSDVPHSADEVLRLGYGDCKEKATLLRALLRAVGIESDYVLVRTTAGGALDRQCYSPGEFDHVILAVPTPQGDRFLDATVSDVPSTMLPPQVEGATGLIIRGTGELVTLPVSTAEENRTAIRVTATVKPDYSAVGRAVLTFHGQTAIRQRALLSTIPADRYREALEGSLAVRLGTEVSIMGVEVTALRDPARPLEISADFASPAFVQAAGMQLSGYLPGFAYQGNPYRSTVKRETPFLQPIASTLDLDVAITLPESIEITHLPEPVAYESAIGAYRDIITADGQTVRYTCHMTVKRGAFPPDRLDEFRKWSSILALDGRNQLQFFLRKR